MDSVPVACLGVGGDDVVLIACKHFSVVVEFPLFVGVDLFDLLRNACVGKLVIHVLVIEVPRSSEHLVKNMICVNHCAQISVEFNKFINTYRYFRVVIMDCIVVHCDCFLEIGRFIVCR